MAERPRFKAHDVGPGRSGSRRKPPFALRPLHHIWRRAIDRVEVSHVSLPVRGLPASLAGLTACQVSDVHVDRDEDVARLEMAVSMINRLSPDFVFLTGDYFSSPRAMRKYIEPLCQALERLRPRYGMFAVAGNHDHWVSFERTGAALKAAGARVLTNSHERVRVGAEQLVIVGIDDLWSGRAEPARAFRGVKPDDCTIVLTHNPDIALYARHLRPGVLLSGHTHGGVVRLPFYGSPIRSVLKLGRQFYAGLNRYDGFYIYTNRGLGTFWIRLRINCRPEISYFRMMPLVDDSRQPGPLARGRGAKSERGRRGLGLGEGAKR